MSNEEPTAPAPASGNAEQRTWLERFLGLFAEVRPGEAANVVLMFANIFLILTAYYMLKVVREGLMIGGVELFGLGGDEIKAYLPVGSETKIKLEIPRLPAKHFCRRFQAG